MGLRLKSLKQRLTLFLLLPVTLLLLGVGVTGFLFTRANLLNQWRHSALFALERAAHSIDMRLEEPGEAMDFVASFAGRSMWSPQELESRLSQIPGVERAKLLLNHKASPQSAHGQRGNPQMRGAPGQRGGHFHRTRISQVGNPVFDTSSGQNLVAMKFELLDQSGAPVGRLEIHMSFDYLMEDLRGLLWWRTQIVYLVDSEGNILARGAAGQKKRTRLGENGDTFELDTLKALKKNKSGTKLSAGYPPDWVSGFQRLKAAPWTFVLFAEGEDVLAPIINFLRFYVAAGILCIILVVFLIRLIAGRMAAEISIVSEKAGEVAQGRYLEVPLSGRQDEIGRLAESFNTMVAGLKQRDFIRDTFGRYVDHEVAKELLSSPEATKLGGHKRLVAIMMTDVRGFTPLCETLSPEQTINVVNRYLSRLIKAIQAHKGIIVDFLGDSVLAFFDILNSSPKEAARAAVCCALELRRATDRFNETMSQENLPQLATGIGLNAGEVVVGNIGSKARTKYGIVGGPVNLTHRIQAQAQGGEIIVSQSVYSLLQSEITVSRSFKALLKGVEEEVSLFAVTAFSDCNQGLAQEEEVKT
jgi:class 3 adenylate cyclase